MSHLGQCHVNVMQSCYVASRCIAIMLCPILVHCHHVMSHLGECYMNGMPSCYVTSWSVSCECDAIMLCRISVYCHHVMSHLGVLPSCYVPSWCIAMGASLKYEKVVFNGEQKKESFV